jgi:hypothetical protein
VVALEHDGFLRLDNDDPDLGGRRRPAHLGNPLR